ncbi:sensor histidine kinase [Saccharothrix syringae]|uniref:sensor histidine kinase n=1 Tax=Saccharothrix syringae TaxID=103733 RepID=UPI000A56A6CC|nr:HAMP domain-containing sensor histidine kinase [Saccharothrix syringae]
MSLRTVSLRRRVALSAIGVLGVALLGVVLLVDGLFAAQSKRDVETALWEKAGAAQQLVKQDVRGAELVTRLENRGVEVRLVMPNGEAFGKAPVGGVANRVDRELPDGSTVTLYAESSLITAAQVRLRRLLLLVGFGVLAVTAAVLVWTVGRALAPLDAMTTLARSIARGKRGYRLNPSSTDNELGRTAAAFDDMLDSLEGSEERTKRFVADAAHELRTPIAGVQAVAEALMQTSDAEERERLNLLLVRESRRAGRLVDDLLALARIDVGLELHRERVDLLALAEAEVGRTRLLAPDFDIEVEGVGGGRNPGRGKDPGGGGGRGGGGGGSGSVFVSGDPQRLAQVLANLADNARQATGPSGRVRVRVSAAGGFALLVVSDNGPGVAPGDRERIFDRLVRLDEARDRRSGGSGLGLAIARGVVRAHGGELTCTDADRVEAVMLDVDEPTLKMKNLSGTAGEMGGALAGGAVAEGAVAGGAVAGAEVADGHAGGVGGGGVGTGDMSSGDMGGGSGSGELSGGGVRGDGSGAVVRRGAAFVVRLPLVG